jgi:16S rRNA (uracil1498-N3)-methyltransferase
VNLFYQPLIPEGIFHLDAEESKHCVRVLRKLKGDVIKVTDGKGFFYDALITKPDSQQCVFEIHEKIQESSRNYFIHIAISPTKNTDRLEWFVEKAVEIGVDKITFIECKNTERPYLKLERMEKVAISAMKQSLKASIPVLKGLSKFSSAIKEADEKTKLIAFVDPSNPSHLKDVAKPASSYLILIGPEGDFSQQELRQCIEAGFIKVSLGPSRLRTETAGIAACHTLNLINE